MSWQGNSNLVAEGNHFGRDMGELGKPSSNFSHHAAYWPNWGAQKRPISSGPAPSGHLLLESLPTPATIQAYWAHSPDLMTHILYSSAGVLGRNCFHFLLSCYWPAPGGSSQHPVPTLVAAPGQTPEKAVQPLHLPRLLGHPGRATLRRMDRAVFQLNPVAPPVLPPGPSSLVVTTLGLGTGAQPVSSDWSA